MTQALRWGWTVKTPLFGMTANGANRKPSLEAAYFRFAPIPVLHESSIELPASVRLDQFARVPFEHSGPKRREVGPLWRTF